MHLVEICVDGGLEAAMHAAQAQLADAYLANGAGAEARIIAEDLVAREPSNPANIDRLQRALALSGERDLDAFNEDRPAARAPILKSHEPPDEVVAGAAKPLHNVSPPAGHSIQDPASAHAIDLSGLFEEDEPTAPSDSVAATEIDLSDALHGMKPGEVAAPPKAQPTVESVLQGVRAEAVHEASSPEVAEQHFKLATTYIEIGLAEEAMSALEVAARSIRHRFRAGALLGKLYMDRNDVVHAVEWFERAAEAPAPSEPAAHQLLYELATALEAQGETDRALAVLLELQSEAGEYRDLAQRLEHLMGR
jgi:tetratricopeptide (TPR) repeat protein